MEKPTLLHLDTFSGIGGFSLAAAWTGRIETIGFVEIDPFCRRVLAKHWPGVPQHGDIKTLTGEQVTDWLVAHAVRQRDADDGRRAVTGETGGVQGEAWQRQRVRADAGQCDHAGAGRIDLITGGFPCQPWSAAGRRRGTYDDRDLWPELARLVATLRPRWCLFENVPGIINMAGGLDRVLADLEAGGYATGTVVVPAAAVGALHRRDRVWIIAVDGGAGRGQLRAHDVPESDAERRGWWTHNEGQQASQRDGDPQGGGRGGHETLGSVGHTPDDVSGWLVGRSAAGSAFPFPTTGPNWEDGVSRVTQHEVDRVSKLKALGNSIVPMVAYEILRQVVAADDEYRKES